MQGMSPFAKSKMNKCWQLRGVSQFRTHTHYRITQRSRSVAGFGLVRPDASLIYGQYALPLTEWRGNSHVTCSYEDGLIARLYQAWYSKPLCNWWGCYLKLPVAMFITKSIRLRELRNHFVWWEPKRAPNSKPFSALASKQKAHDSSRWRTWQDLVESNIYFKLIIFMLQRFVIFCFSAFFCF